MSKKQLRYRREIDGINLKNSLKELSSIRYDSSGVKLETTAGGGVSVGEESPLIWSGGTPPELQGQTTVPLQVTSAKDLMAPIVSEEEAAVIKKFFDDNPFNDKSGRKSPIIDTEDSYGEYRFNNKDPWIQTFTGRRFTPTNPNPDAILIRDIAHALSMQCRFSGHVKKFYSVAQHSVLVSYICDSADALYGLLHDASEAYLLDLAAPLKRSGYFNNFIEIENKLMKAVCHKFGLPEVEPPSVKKADTQLLVTESRDLMTAKRSDWIVNAQPLLFKIEPWSPDEAEDKFMYRFFELMGYDSTHYEHYMHYKYKEVK